ncbi:hypothetical protein PTSG_08363 [Salpingoeca rosetta]|uniref:Transcription factor 25 n=1 Tax=Salpingoeca rosetta (strain ATCC 50818 / BSB-021) TaxID=946362 RepID=F2UJH0_SALR5|nr:uncharacterized protein PTSG_08363 [Salpingoeca rosetta]EGD77269.1 hypothetical protein PTSG_08363 [Salpingoeca rosetta]|eukprot:XP_004990613.1 hypothetical protein PTSG_08363 [Salpingoeca rosetta]
MSSRHLRRLRRLRGDNPETDLAVEPESERTHADQRQGQPSDGNDDGSNSNDSDNDSDSKGEAAPASRFSAFAALMDEEEEEDDDEEEQEEEQHEQEKPTQQPAEDEQDGVAEALAQSKRKKNRKRRNKKKNKKRQTPVPRLDDDDDDDEEEEEEEEHDGLATKDNGGADEVRQKAGGSLPNNDNDDGDLDALIKSVQEQFGETGEGATSSKPGGQQDPSLSEQSILAVDRRYLNAEKELQRKFKARTSGRATHTFQTPQHRVRGRAVRSAMVTPKPDWPPLGRLGITMTVDKDAQPPPSQPSSSSSSPSSASTATATATAGNARQHVFRFAHSSSYREVQQLFLRAVKGYDPRAFEHILRRHPYHVDTLLQMSQVVRVHGDTAQAGELVERALYCFEANMHPMFNPSKGDCFLDYRYYENRAFFIALFKHISYVSHRGCWRTALECCKLLLALDPDNDPVAAILLIDYFALRSRELSYFLSLCRVWGAKKKLDWLPNFAFSHALAEYMLSL